MIFHLPPLVVTIRAVAELPTEVFIARRGRTTAILVQAGLTRRQIREALGDDIRPAELALIRRSMSETTDPNGLPADLDAEVCFPGQLLVCHRNSPPVAYLHRFG